MNTSSTHLKRHLNQALEMFSVESCFGVALCLFALTGCLQASPVQRQETQYFGQGNLGLGFVRQQVTCVNVTFSAPTNTEVKCLHEALQSFITELEGAKSNCTGGPDRIDDSLEHLETIETQTFSLENQTKCKLQKRELQFKEFLDALESFVHKLNSLPSKSEKP